MGASFFVGRGETDPGYVIGRRWKGSTDFCHKFRNVLSHDRVLLV